MVNRGLDKQHKQGQETLYQEHKSTATKQDIKKYNDYNLVLRKVKRYTKKKYYLDRCIEFKANMRELWKRINQVIGRNSDKSTCINEPKTENLLITRQKDIANELGKFFSTVGEICAKKTPISKKDSNYYLSLIFRNDKAYL